jgi:hypothetical protein
VGGGEGNLLFQGAIDDIREYLKLAMGVRAESRTRLDAVLVDHAQTPELVML